MSLAAQPGTAGNADSPEGAEGGTRWVCPEMRLSHADTAPPWATGGVRRGTQPGRPAASMELPSCSVTLALHPDVWSSGRGGGPSVPSGGLCPPSCGGAAVRRPLGGTCSHRFLELKVTLS